MGIGELITLGMTVLIPLGSVVFILIITAVSCAVPIGLMFVIFRVMAKNAEAERELLATGVPAPAKIIAVGETGMYINDRPQVQLILEVSPPEGEVFTAKIHRVISVLQVPQVQPGRVVEVRYDPRNLSRVALVGL